MAGYLLMCFVAVANTGFAQVIEKPFTEVPDNPTYVPVGSDARLKWSFPVGDDFKEVEIQYQDVGPFNTLMIKKKGQAAIVNPNIQLPKNLTERVAIDGYATFVISNIYPEDTNYRYRCSYIPTTGGSTITNDVQIVLSEPPENITVTPRCQTINTGESARFECTADGVPTPELEWYDGYGKKVESRADVEINSSNGSSSLTFRSVNSTDSGTYICKVKNVAGKGNASVVLVVPSCEVRGMLPQTSTYSVEVGKEVPLVCPVYGFPQPEIVWEYPNKPNQTFRYNNLLVKVTSDGNLGVYYCSGCGKTFAFKLEKRPLLSSTVSPVVPQKSCSDEHIALGVLIPAFIIIIIVLFVLWWRAVKKEKDASQQAGGIETDELSKGDQDT